MLKRVLAIGAILLGIVAGNRAEAAGPALEVHFDVMDFGVHKMYLLVVVNKGKSDVTVITENLQWGTGRAQESDRIDATFGYSDSESWKTHQLIPSLAGLGPVVLRPNEAALLKVDLELLIEKIQEKLPNEGVVVVNYRVGKKWGARFGIWHGSVSTSPLKITGGTISPTTTVK